MTNDDVGVVKEYDLFDLTASSSEDDDDNNNDDDDNELVVYSDVP